MDLGYFANKRRRANEKIANSGAPQHAFKQFMGFETVKVFVPLLALYGAIKLELPTGITVLLLVVTLLAMFDFLHTMIVAGRAYGVGGDRHYDRNGPPILGPEYADSESATKARERRERQRDQ